jgi:hypothetical protein
MDRFGIGQGSRLTGHLRLSGGPRRGAVVIRLRGAADPGEAAP